MRLSLSPAIHISAAILLSAAAILCALVLQHGFGYLPCKLCFEQRTPYYFGIPLLVAALSLVLLGYPKLSSNLCLLISVLFVYGALLGVHHSGVEWGFWEGPGDCGMVSLGSNYGTASLLEQIQNTKVVSCTDAALRVLGLSLAGWNAVVASCVAVLSFVASTLLFRRKH